MSTKKIAAIISGLAFIGIGLTHFTKTRFFERIVPPRLPAPRLLVYISGIAEIVLGAGLIIPKARQAAARGAIALLLAVYPANIYMARNWQDFTDIAPSKWFHVVRLPMQFAMIALMAWLGDLLPTAEPHSTPAGHSGPKSS